MWAHDALTSKGVWRQDDNSTHKPLLKAVQGGLQLKCLCYTIFYRANVYGKRPFSVFGIICGIVILAVLKKKVMESFLYTSNNINNNSLFKGRNNK